MCIQSLHLQILRKRDGKNFNLPPSRFASIFILASASIQTLVVGLWAPKHSLHAVKVILVQRCQRSQQIRSLMNQWIDRIVTCCEYQFIYVYFQLRRARERSEFSFYVFKLIHFMWNDEKKSLDFWKLPVCFFCLVKKFWN